MCDRIDVVLRQGVTVDYAANSRITVVGRFKITPQIIDGYFYSLFCLEDAVVVAE